MHYHVPAAYFIYLNHNSIPTSLLRPIKTNITYSVKDPGRGIITLQEKIKPNIRSGGKVKPLTPRPSALMDKVQVELPNQVTT